MAGAAHGTPLETVFPCDGFRPMFIADWNPVSDRRLNGRQIRLGLRAIDNRRPVGGLQNRPHREREISAEIATSPKASPSPIFCTLHEVRPQWIALNIPEHGNQVTFGLNRKGVISVLIHMTEAP
jgi:hypothetical protein